MQLKDRVRIAMKAAVGVFSENAVKEAYGMLTGIMPGVQGAPPSRGTLGYLQAYSQMPWLRAVAGRVAGAVAATEWQLYVRKGKDDAKARRDFLLQRAGVVNRKKLLKQAAAKEELQQIDSHVMLDTIHNANGFQTGDAMWKTTQLHLDLVGEAFWLKERDALGTVVGIWPVPPNWILNTPTPVHRFFRVGFRAWRGSIPDTEFIWFSDPDPANPYGRGSGTTQALADELETDEYAAKHTKAFFYNRARPDLLVFPKAPERLRQPDVERLEEDWTRRNQGFWKAFKPYFLTREVGVEKLEQNFRSLTLVQLREFERNAIIQQFGMPPELLGVIENSNRATINAADYLFSRYVVQPRLEFLRAILQERLVPEYDERLIIDYVSPVQDDTEMQIKAATAGPFALSVNEWREMMGKEPLDGEEGDLHAVPTLMQMTTLKEANEIANRPPPTPVLPGGPKPGAPKPPPPERAIRLRAPDDEELAKQLKVDLYADATLLGDDPEQCAAVLRALADNPDDLPEPSVVAGQLEPEFVRGLMEAWAEAAAAVDMTRLEEACIRQDANDITVELQLSSFNRLQSAAIESRLTSTYLRGVELGEGPVNDLLDEGEERSVKRLLFHADLRAADAEAQRWARQHAAELVQAGPRTQARIRALIVQSIRDGVPPRELAKLIRNVIGLTDQQSDAVARFRARLRQQGVSGDALSDRVARYAQAQRRARALTIARTELIAAINGGQQTAWQQAVKRGLLSPDLMARVWIVTDDERLEAKCEALGNHAPVGLNEPWPGGIMQPPAHPRCRCAMGLVAKGRKR